MINDEIMEDSGSACEVAPGQFGMKWIALHSMCYKNIVKKNSADSGCDHIE